GGEREHIEVRLAREPPRQTPPEVASPLPPPAGDDTAAHALWVATGVSAVLTLGALGYWIDQEVAVGQCEARPCANEARIRSQRAVGLGLTIGAAGLTASLAIGAAVLLAIPPRAASRAGFRCAPSLRGLACAGRF